MQMNATVTIRVITPEIADEWLQNLWGEQRQLRLSQVKRLVQDINAGEFLLGPDAILRVKGKLANGQHRLAAIKESGKSQQFLVLESTDEELYRVIDNGMKRTITDGLKSKHIPFRSYTPSIARWVIAYDEWVTAKEQQQKAGAVWTSKAMLARDYTAWSQSGIIRYCEENAEMLAEAAGYVHPLYEKTRLLSLSIGGALYILGARHEKEKTKTFLTQAYEIGGDNAAGDLHNRLVANMSSRAKLKNSYIFNISLKALRAHLNGTRPGVLKLCIGEESPVL